MSNQTPNWWPFPAGLGRLIAAIILILVILLIIMGQMKGPEAWLFAGLAAAVLLG